MTIETNETAAASKRGFPTSMVAAAATCALALAAAGGLLTVSGAFAAPETSKPAVSAIGDEGSDEELDAGSGEESIGEETVVDEASNSGDSSVSGDEPKEDSGKTPTKPNPKPDPKPDPEPEPEPEPDPKPDPKPVPDPEPPRVFTDSDAQNAIASRYGASASLSGECYTLNYGTWGGSNPWTATPPAPRTDLLKGGALGWSASASGGGGKVTYYSCF